MSEHSLPTHGPDGRPTSALLLRRAARNPNLTRPLSSTSSSQSQSLHQSTSLTSLRQRTHPPPIAPLSLHRPVQPPPPSATAPIFDWRPQVSMVSLLSPFVSDITQAHWTYLREWMRDMQANYNQLHGIHNASLENHQLAAKKAFEEKTAMGREIRSLREELKKMERKREEERKLVAMKEVQNVVGEIEKVYGQFGELDRAAKMAYRMLQGAVGELDAYRERFGGEFGDEWREKRRVAEEKEKVKMKMEAEDGDVDMLTESVVEEIGQMTVKTGSEPSMESILVVFRGTPKTPNKQMTHLKLADSRMADSKMADSKMSDTKMTGSNTSNPKTTETPKTIPKTPTVNPPTPQTAPKTPTTNPPTPQTAKSTPKGSKHPRSINPRLSMSAARALRPAVRPIVGTRTRHSVIKHDDEIHEWMNGASSHSEGGYDSTSLAGY